MKYTLIAVLVIVLSTSCTGPVTGTMYTPGVDENGVYIDVDNPKIKGHTKIRKSETGYDVEKDIDGKAIPVISIKDKMK